MKMALSPEIFAIYFSAFSAHALEIDGLTFPTLEHASLGKELNHVGRIWMKLREELRRG